MHRAQQVLNAIHSALSPLVGAGINELLKSRVEPPRTYPCVIIRMGPDDPLESANTAFLDSVLTVNTDIYVTSTSADLDKDTLAVRTLVHKALMTDRTLGLSFVADTNFTGQSDPDYTGEGQDYAGATRLSWQVRYRSSFTDPEN